MHFARRRRLVRSRSVIAAAAAIERSPAPSASAGSRGAEAPSACGTSTFVRTLRFFLFFWHLNFLVINFYVTSSYIVFVSGQTVATEYLSGYANL